MGRERRTDCRYRINAPTLVKSKTEGIAAAFILEASRTGLSLSLPFRLPVNSEIEIRLEDQMLSGQIRNCTCIRAMEFHAGIQIGRPASTEEECGLTHVPVFERAKALQLYSPGRVSRVRPFSA